MDASGNHFIKIMVKQNNLDSEKQMHIYSDMWTLDMKLHICVFMGHKTRKKIIRWEE